MSHNKNPKNKLIRFNFFTKHKKEYEFIIPIKFLTIL